MSDALRSAGLPFISVIIPARNAALSVARQLTALDNQDYLGRWEILVVDNGSSDGTADLLTRWEAGGVGRCHLTDPEPRGSYHARNVGARASHGDLLAFCDADDEVESSWLSNLARGAVDHDAVAGALEPRQVSNRSMRGSEGLPITEMPKLLDFLPYGFTANFAVWRDIFEAVGEWSEDYVSGGDAEFCWRLQLAGYTLAFVPDARVTYNFRSTPKDLRRQFFRYAVAHVRLYSEHRTFGARRPGVISAIRSWCWILLNGLALPWAVPEKRGRWIIASSTRAGHLWGSLIYRTVFP